MLHLHIVYTWCVPLHFFDKGGFWVGEDDAIDTTKRSAGIEEVDPEVSVVTFLTLADVLQGEKERAKFKVQGTKLNQSHLLTVYSHIATAPMIICPAKDRFGQWPKSIIILKS